MAKIIDLLHEFQDLFPTKFFEMKGILGDLEEMKIPLKLDVKSVIQRPYRLICDTRKGLKLSWIGFWMLE